MDQDAIPAMITECLKLHVGRNENLDRMRSKLYVEAMKMMQELMQIEKEEPLCGNNNLEQRGMLQLLNYLIVDYFNWHGFRNTMKTFEMETGDKSRPKPREKLQQELSAAKCFHTELPILLQMLLKESKENYETLLDQRMWANIPLKPVPDSKKLRKSSGRVRLPKSNKGQKKMYPIEDKSCLASSKKETGISTKTSWEKSKQKSNNEIQEKPAKELKDRAKSLELFSNVLKDFPALKHEIRKKTMNKESTQTKSEATAQAILDIVATLQGSKALPKKTPRNLRSLQEQPASLLEARKKDASIKVANLPLRYVSGSPVTSEAPAAALPRDPVIVNEINSYPKKKVNVRQRMVEFPINGTRAH